MTILISSSYGVARKSKSRSPLDSGRVVTADSIGNVIQAYRVKDQVYFSKSTDGGKSFGAKVKVGDSSIFPAGSERLYLQAFSGKGQFFNRQILLSWVLSRNHPESTFGAVIYAKWQNDSNFTLLGFLGEKKPVPRETTHTSTGGIFSPVQNAEANPSPPPDHSVEAPRHFDYPKPPDIKGDLDGDILRTPMDVAYLVNNIFFGKPFPPHTIRKGLSSADVNCDKRISPADLVVELRAVFLRINLSCS